MTPTLIPILISVILVSAISLTGALYFVLSHASLTASLKWLVAFAAGTLLGASLFDLVPESFEMLGGGAPIYIVGGILIFLLFEQVLHWHHEHRHNCDDCDTEQATGYAVLLGDGLHNFIDGVLIASSWLTDPGLGLATTVAIAMHEIPQELGDFAVLLHSGFTKPRALLFNLASALVAVAGALLAYFWLQTAEGAVPYLLAIGAGGLLYIALTDLLSEIKHQPRASTRLGQVAVLIAGLLLMARLTA